MSTQSPAKTLQPDALRSQLVEFLRGGSAHVDPKTALSGIPEKFFDSRPRGAPHSPWELLEHLRFTLRDLLDFCTNADYIAPAWPEDYWPSDAPRASGAWQKAIDGLFADLSQFEALVEDPETDLTANIPWGQGQTILREVLLAIDHTSYHLGQIVLVRQQLDQWQH